MEVSPGWGHWGVLNVNFSEKETGNIVNASTATPPDIIKAGHEASALVIVHHPYSDYGFLHNQDSVAGGHADGWKDFDLLELQSTISSDGKRTTRISTSISSAAPSPVPASLRWMPKHLYPHSHSGMPEKRNI